MSSLITRFTSLVKNGLSNTLIFFNLLDVNKNLSITNLLVIGFSIKFLFFMPSIDLGDITMLLGTFAVYAHKKYLINSADKTKAEADVASLHQRLDELQSSVEQTANDVAKVKLAYGAQKLR